MNLASLRRGSASVIVLLLGPAFANSQGFTIDHAQIGCLVAGKYPAVDACFAPAADLARARVYFRPEGTTSWYYVDSWGHLPPRAQSTCLQTTLPRPKKSMVSKRVEYYVQAVGKSLGESQTPLFSPVVVEKESECAKGKKAAAVLPSAIGNVLPGLPPGFIGAGGALGTVAAVVGAGALGGAIGVIVGRDGGGGASPTTTPASTTPPITTAPATTTTPPSATAFNAVFKIFRGSVLETGNLIIGSEPLPLRFVMCESTGPLRMHFGVFVNGAQATANCDSLITFTNGGFVATSVGQGGSGTAAAPPGPSYNVRMSIQSDGPNNNPKASRDVVVDLSGGSTTTTTTTTTLPGCQVGDSQGPTVMLLGPLPPKRYPFPDPYPVNFMASASDTTTGNSNVARVEYFFGVNQSTPPFQGLATVGQTSIPAGNYPLSWSAAAAQAFLGTVCEAAGEAYAVATDNCGNTTRSAGAYPIVIGLSVACPPTTLTRRDGAPPRLDAESAFSGGEQAFVSQLEMAGARGQVVPNGSQVFFPERGRTLLRARLRTGENRVEATIVQAQGKAGTWRFDLSPLSGLEPGSLHVIAGEVAQIAGDVVVFRLKGTPGERVVFAFRVP